MQKTCSILTLFLLTALLSACIDPSPEGYFRVTTKKDLLALSRYEVLPGDLDLTDECNPIYGCDPSDLIDLKGLENLKAIEGNIHIGY